VRTSASSSDSYTVSISGERCSAFMRYTVSVNDRSTPNWRDALKLEPYST